MGSGTTYQEAGKHHGDTKSYNDEDQLKLMYGAAQPNQIT